MKHVDAQNRLWILMAIIFRGGGGHGNVVGT
jgi:hypothetical protein